jgi:hypothetical protein
LGRVHHLQELTLRGAEENERERGGRDVVSGAVAVLLRKRLETRVLLLTVSALSSTLPIPASAPIMTVCRHTYNTAVVDSSQGLNFAR